MNIALSPSGDLRLFIEDYSIDLPPTVGGLNLIISILQARVNGKTALAQPGSPTQFQIDEWVASWKDKQQSKAEAEFIALGDGVEL